MLELMCDCTEIQDEWKRMFANSDKTRRFYDSNRFVDRQTGLPTGRKEVEVVWLPTQKQIQDMLKEQWFGVTDHYIRTEFHRWYNETNLARNTWELTGDEIWVAFYMHRIYNKVWQFKTKKKQWKEV